MIKRLIICFLLIGAPFTAGAQSVEESIVTQLRTQGFSQITTNRTWLGRVRVVAERGDTKRELVFNPQTGEILRDYWKNSQDSGRRATRIVDPDDRNSGSGSGDDGPGETGGDDGPGGSGGDDGPDGSGGDDGPDGSGGDDGPDGSGGDDGPDGSGGDDGPDDD